MTGEGHTGANRPWSEDERAEMLAHIDANDRPTIRYSDGSQVPEPEVTLGPDETKALLERGDVRAILYVTGARPLSRVSRDPAAPLLLDRLDAQEATVLYGNGGAGKGTITSAWIVGLVAAGHRVLILDYENHPSEWARRIASLGGVETLSDVVHVSPVAASWQGPRGAIWEQADELAELALRAQCSYLVVDSAVTACGATNPLDPEAPGQYFAALARLGLPSLTLAHVTGAGDLTKPFGSVFWHNLARVTWSVTRTGGEGHRVLLQHRKDNNHERQGKHLVTVEWRDGLPREVNEVPYHLKLGGAIDEVLVKGSLTVAEIVRRLNAELEEDEPPVKADSVRAALRRGFRARPQVFTVNGDGQSARWSRVA